MQDEVNEQKAPDTELMTCPCCKQRTLTMPPKPNQSIIDHYLACILSGNPFVHTYSFWKGTVVATISALSERERAAVIKLQKVLEKDMDKDEYQMLNRRLCCYVYINEIVTTVGDITTTYTPQIDIQQAAEDQLAELLLDNKHMSGVPLDVLEQAVSAHMIVNSALQSAAIDETFWEGIELA